MSVCPVCKRRVTNGADQVKREGIRLHKHHGFVNPIKYKQRERRKILRENKRSMERLLIQSVGPRTAREKKPSPFKRLYQIFKERAGL